MNSNVADQLLTPDQIKERLELDIKSYMQCKYVRIGDQFLFIDELNSFVDVPSHACMARGREEEVVSAGRIQLYKDLVCVGDYSVTLDKGPASDDYGLIAKLFDLPVQNWLNK